MKLLLWKPALMLLCLAASSGLAYGNASVVTYQGVLSDNGASFSGTAQMSFALYDDATAGTEVWAENQGTVSVAGGSFVVLLGSVTPFGTTFEDHSNLWLEVSADVGAGPQTFAPRVAFAAAPYALMATRAASAATADVATTALSADTATTADSATNADNATTADFATTAGSATTAQSADNATTADFATTAGNATTADSATTALSANTATTADSATTAGSATTADSATTATTADTATTALSADSVDWSGIQNVPGDLADGGDAATLNGLGSGAFAPASHTHVASNIVGGIFEIARMPIGTGASQVATGNHTHDASAIVSGTFDISQLPVGTGATQVAVGNHTHNSLSNADNSLPNRVFVNPAGNVGINTTTPGEALEINGAMQFTGNNAVAGQTTGVISRAPRVIRTNDPVAGCPPARAAGTDLFTQTFTLTRSAAVEISASIIRRSTGRVDLFLYVNGGLVDRTITNTGPTLDWLSGEVKWVGVLGPGNYTVSLRSPTANVWGCNADWGSINTVIYE